MDLHTRTGLIGRRDLEVTLASLRLDEEEIEGYIDIYAVCRVLERGVPNFVDLPEMGKDSLFKLSASWVSLTPIDMSVDKRKLHRRTK